MPFRSRVISSNKYVSLLPRVLFGSDPDWSTDFIRAFGAVLVVGCCIFAFIVGRSLGELIGILDVHIADAKSLSAKADLTLEKAMAAVRLFCSLAQGYPGAYHYSCHFLASKATSLSRNYLHWRCQLLCCSDCFAVADAICLATPGRFALLYDINVFIR